MKTPISIQMKWETLKEKGDLDELSLLIGMSKPAISRILNGHQNTSIRTIQTIKDFLKDREKELNKIKL